MDQTAALELQDEARTEAGPVAPKVRYGVGRDRARRAFGPRTGKTLLLWTSVLVLVVLLLWSGSATSGRFDPLRIALLVLSIVLPVSLVFLARPRKS